VAEGCRTRRRYSGQVCAMMRQIGYETGIPGFDGAFALAIATG
jgi:threonine dehydrogenase-like Zn-dependent dehydrogenase